MREIKFRVWSAKRKEMTGGMPLAMLAGWISAKYPNLDDEIYLQSTGLHDKNGKDVYVGDILDVEPKRGYWVCLEGVACFEFQRLDSYVNPIENERVNEIKPFWLLAIESKGEVIGNIHENPELVK